MLMSPARGARYETITHWVNDRGWKKGAELGIFDGRTHLYLLANCPGLELIGVDVWDLPGFREGPSKSGEKCFCDWCNETRAARRAETVAQMRKRVIRETAIYKGRSVILQMTTAEAAGQVEDASLDFVFVDGDHSTEGVSADVTNWRPKLKVGGMMIGHDWNLRSVREGVAQHFESQQIVLGQDHLWFAPC